jgi:hypothetical protein
MKEKEKEKTLEELKAVKEHMENRTQWHTKDVKEVEKVRNKVDSLEKEGELTEADKASNKVTHHH